MTHVSISTLSFFPTPNPLSQVASCSDARRFYNKYITPIMTLAIQLSASWFSNHLLLTATSTIFTYFVIRIFYNLFLAPLSAIPGPWYFAISDFWLTLHVLRLRQCKVIQELFEIYGPVVRVGPNKVVFRDLSTMRNVYSVHKFDKSSFYKSLLTYATSVSQVHPKLTLFYRPAGTTTTMRALNSEYMRLFCVQIIRLSLE